MKIFIDLEKTEVELLDDGEWHVCVRDVPPSVEIDSRRTEEERVRAEDDAKRIAVAPRVLSTPCQSVASPKRTRTMMVGAVTCSACREEISKTGQIDV